MSLASTLGFEFDGGVQQRGHGLWQAGAVRVRDAGIDHVWGSVRGGALYDVRLTLHGKKLLVSCECPYYNDIGPCKHIWAMILESDQRGVPADARNHRLELEIEEEFPDDDFDDDDAEDFDPPTVPPVFKPARHVYEPPKRFPAWHEVLTDVENRLGRQRESRAAQTAPTEVYYVLDVSATRTSGGLTFELFGRSLKKNGQWGVRKELRLTPDKAGHLSDPVDADIVGAMFGGQDPFLTYSYYQYPATAHRKALPYRLATQLVPRIAATGRMQWRELSSSDVQPLAWDEGEPWRLRLEVKQDERDQWNITGFLWRGEERMPLSEPLFLLDGGFLLHSGKLARFEPEGLFPWVSQLREARKISFPDRERDLVMQRLLSCSAVPPMDIDEQLRFEERAATPRLGIRLNQRKNAWGEMEHVAQLVFDYGRGWTAESYEGRGTWYPEDRVYLLRDRAAEQGAADTLSKLGLRRQPGPETLWALSQKALPRIVRETIRLGWHVEANGKAFRRATGTRVAVSSGIDWFELHAEVDFDGEVIPLPKLLSALRRGDTMVVLGDGTFGLLPEEWLARFAPVAGLGSDQDGHVRFRRNQAGLLDALLAAQPDVDVDQMFAHVREQMRRFHGIQAAPQPDGFVGQLRDYQREGVGWMQFLREFGFGGCLADDMGVGKTAQVLATLEERRAQGFGPSLVVAPKSVIFNWREEAARFTPQLRVLEHVGIGRDEALIPNYHMVLTTYGTLVRDVASLSKFEFDYVVLDEAQAVKNATTATAKAVRLLRGRHRLALSGTPVENHLGELWSLFEFLNPGMLGEAKVLNMSGGLARNPGEEARLLLAQALRPFILRRTKQQVARELPSKTEQTLFCELEGPQKKQYDELRKHYRDTLLSRVAEQGLGKSKMHVLEALLRLRQAACHPGLLDARRVDEPSAKLDTLLDQLQELREEGHKALVFSQFTSLLAIVRRRLDAAGTPYQYLDGQTRDRQQRVDSFQTNPDIGLFLISLKAGGLGLNLTAADYVFLLDPWWNPAVEAQAVDRAHRIGQTKPVFAYRIIARDTVEEKVLELQKTKRDLADAILSEDNSLIRDLKREDLELLLS